MVDIPSRILTKSPQGRMLIRTLCLRLVPDPRSSMFHWKSNIRTGVSSAQDMDLWEWTTGTAVDPNKSPSIKNVPLKGSTPPPAGSGTKPPTVAKPATQPAIGRTGGTVRRSYVA